MAPELHRGAAATPASDVYSLGCLLWATLSGRAPFIGSTDYQMVTAHLEQPVPRLDGTSELTVAVNAVLTRAMAKDPAHRYEDAAAMRDALRAARRLEPDGSETARPVPARGAPAPDPDPGLEPQQADAGRSTRRLRTVAAGALVAVAVVTGLVVADALRGADDTVPGAVPTSSAEPSPQARPPAGPDAGRGAAVRSLARALRATGDLTDAQSRCVARGLVDRLGLARMVEAGMLTEDYALGAPGDEVPRDVEKAVVSASADCA